MKYPLEVRLMACEPKYRAEAALLVTDIAKRRILADEFSRLNLYPDWFVPPLRCNETVGAGFIANALAFLDYVKGGVKK